MVSFDRIVFVCPASQHSISQMCLFVWSHVPNYPTLIFVAECASPCSLSVIAAANIPRRTFNSADISLFSSNIFLHVCPKFIQLGSWLFINWVIFNSVHMPATSFPSPSQLTHSTNALSHISTSQIHSRFYLYTLYISHWCLWIGGMRQWRLW